MERMTKTAFMSEGLPKEALQAFPVLFNEKPHPMLSARYAPVPTIQVIEKMEGMGFLPAQVQVQRLNKVARVENNPFFDRDGFQLHKVTFTSPNWGTVSKGEMIPTISLINSMDGKSMFKTIMGFFRLVCTNGLMLPVAGANSSFKVKHFLNGMDYTAFMENLHAELENHAGFLKNFSLKKYKSVFLSEDQKETFAREALLSRYTDEEIKKVSISEVLVPMREQDGGNTLWNVFNTLQEKLEKGEVYLTTPREEKDDRIRKSKPMAAINANTNMQQMLWSLLEKYATAA